jgi:DME family drug/metabolite transporter
VAGVLDALAGRRPRPTWTIGVGVALGGVALLTGWSDEPAWDGVGLAVVAGAAAAVLGFAGQRLMRDRPALPAMATVVGGGAVLLLPVAVRGATTAFGTGGAAFTVVYLGVFTMTAAYALWGVGLGHLPLAVVAAITLAEPAVAAVLAVVVLGDATSTSSLAGAAFVLAGVAVATVGPARRASPPPGG